MTSEAPSCASHKGRKSHANATRRAIEGHTPATTLIHLEAPHFAASWARSGRRISARSDAA
jgi:hypothetical protein